MELFPFTESGPPLLLSASESGLFLHPVRNERFGHPFLLCSGYKSGFSGCVYNDFLYYVYINKENSLLLRRLRESTLLFRLDGTETVTYRDPQLVVFEKTLFLFYMEEAQGSYRLKLRLPFSDAVLRLPEPLQVACPEPPLLFLQATDHYLYLFLTIGTSTVSYRYSATASFEALCSEKELLSGLRIPWEAEKKLLEQWLMQVTHLSEQQQKLLTEKEQKLDHTSRLLERAKSQYNDLMQVAEQYRQEALKWYGKFTDRN